MATTLVKHPAESRVYTFDFASVFGGGSRGSTWAGNLFGTGETFLPAITLPLLLSLVNKSAIPVVLVARNDGQGNDLVLGQPVASGSQVLVRLSGGTDGMSYTLTCEMTTNQGNILVVEGILLVTSSLP